MTDDIVVAGLRTGRNGKGVIGGLVATFTSSKSSIELGTEFATDPLPIYHFKVYTRIVQKGRLLYVRKTRGPCTGLLDLPRATRIR